MTTYSQAGVNIEWGDGASKILYQAAKETWKNRTRKLGEIIVHFDDFSGLRVVREAKKNGLEANVAGKVTSTRGIVIHPPFSHNGQNSLRFF